jgi:hypothetical protein
MGAGFRWSDGVAYPQMSLRPNLSVDPLACRARGVKGSRLVRHRLVAHHNPFSAEIAAWDRHYVEVVGHPRMLGQHAKRGKVKARSLNAAHECLTLRVQ